MPVLRGRLLSFFLVLAFCAGTLVSQSSNAILSGTVKDPSGAVLQGAKVETQPALRPVTTDSRGEFNLTGVEPGTYTVTITYVGFAPFKTTITASPGQVANVNAVLKVASAADEVVVTAERPPR